MIQDRLLVIGLIYLIFGIGYLVTILLIIKTRYNPNNKKLYEDYTLAFFGLIVTLYFCLGGIFIYEFSVRNIQFDHSYPLAVF